MHYTKFENGNEEKQQFLVVRRKSGYRNGYGVVRHTLQHIVTHCNTYVWDVGVCYSITGARFLVSVLHIIKYYLMSVG